MLFSLFSLYPTTITADVTLYGIAPANEGEFLTEAFQQTSIAAGPDGVITVIDKSATDGIIAHGTYGVTLVESSNGLVFEASGSLYTEYMSCVLDTRVSEASCLYTISISGSTITGAFQPTKLPVITAVPTGESTTASSTTASVASSGKPTQTSASSSSTSHSGLSTGALVGIIVAIVIVVLILISLLFFLMVLRRRRHSLMREAAEIEKFELDPSARPTHFPTFPVEAGSESVTGILPATQSSSPLFDNSSSSAASEKRRMFFAANADADRPRSPPTSVPSLDTQSSAWPTVATRSVTSQSPSHDETDVDPRQILEEMRRMREEVAHLRTEANIVPPEYAE